MRFVFLFLLIFGFTQVKTSAQLTPQFFSGDFEVTYDTVGCFPVLDTFLNYFYAKTVRDIGADGRVYHGDTSCAMPHGGNHFLGLYDDGGTQQGIFSLWLTSPLVPANLYKITYYSRAAADTMPAIDIEIGYSTDSSQVGIAAGRMDAPPDDTWMMQTIYFRPNNAAQFITVSGMPNTPNVDSGLIYLDDFSIQEATDVSSVAAQNSVEVMPNPATDYIIVTGDALEGNTVANISDIAGHKMQCQKEQQTNGDMIIDVSGLSPGMYLLHLTDNHMNIVKKIVVAR